MFAMFTRFAFLLDAIMRSIFYSGNFLAETMAATFSGMK